MKTAEGCHMEIIVCNCPYCNSEQKFYEHEHCYAIDPKSTKETCTKCGKSFWLKKEE